MIPDAITPFVGSSAPGRAAAVVTVSRVVQGASYLFIHAHAWTTFAAVTPLPAILYWERGIERRNTNPQLPILLKYTIL